MTLRRSNLRTLLSASFLGLASAACSSAVAEPPPEPELAGPVADNLKGCYGKASSSIPASGVYVLTTFGGPGESQPLSCGGSSKSGSWYYAASRQRYGCGARVRIQANGKCVVAQTDDYGPDVCVENAVGAPIMDVSPLIAEHLFGESELGWSDKRKVSVAEVSAKTPLGSCSGKPDGPAQQGAGGTGGSNAGGSGGGSGGFGGSNSGSGGSASGGAIGCTPSLCQSSTPATTASGSACYCDAACLEYADCCSNYAAVCGGSAGSGGGASCSSDGQCNPGNDGSGLICVGGSCVPGCHQNAHCPGIKLCKYGQCV